MTKEKPTLTDLTAEAVEQERALMLEAEQIKSDTFLGLLEARRQKAWLVAVHTYQHLREVAHRN